MNNSEQQQSQQPEQDSDGNNNSGWKRKDPPHDNDEQEEEENMAITSTDIKRDRDKKRRGELSDKLDELSELVFQIDPALISGRTADNGVVETGNVSESSAQSAATASKKSSSGSIVNRTELIKRCIRLLEKLSTDSLEKGKQIENLKVKIRSVLEAQQQIPDVTASTASLSDARNRNIFSPTAENQEMISTLSKLVSLPQCTQGNVVSTSSSLSMQQQESTEGGILSPSDIIHHHAIHNLKQQAATVAAVAQFRNIASLNQSSLLNAAAADGMAQAVRGVSSNIPEQLSTATSSSFTIETVTHPQDILMQQQRNTLSSLQNFHCAGSNSSLTHSAMLQQQQIASLAANNHSNGTTQASTSLLGNQIDLLVNPRLNHTTYDDAAVHRSSMLNSVDLARENRNVVAVMVEQQQQMQNAMRKKAEERNYF
eukprot:CAMPEP_0194144966 /NCGR_PEP_ID=MMETSP0152-20130528/13915_1 /TAXON_ID=1049557 /ORGANISM="Thalassiothrix antarctica, Strain L6-D1" /LENGTH=427 /DNA_ID=CAMNT_0038844991 /DNA_START=79 /DNA_END=1362 /DNA_ORIENTATION=-